MVAVHALAQLIEEVRQMSDPPMSVRELGRRVGVSPSRMHQLINDPMKSMPDPDTLRGLAKGLRLPLRIVVDAALRSLGLPAPEPPAQGTLEQMRRIVEGSTRLSPDLRQTWLAMIDSLEQQLDRRARRAERGPVPVDVDVTLEEALVDTKGQNDLRVRRAALEKAAELLDNPSLTDEQRGWLRDRVLEQRRALDAEAHRGGEHHAL